MQKERERQIRQLSKIAVQIDGEVTADIQNFVSVIEPTLVIVLSVLVGGMLLSVMMPLMGDTFCDWIAGDELRWNRM